MNTGKLSGLTAVITGASRGIGKAIALKLAKDGANIVIAAKTVAAHPTLPGTIYTAAKEIEEAGGQCLPCVVDVREEMQVDAAVENAVKQFGGIDILINNASAISLTGTLETSMKKYDLMHQINIRGTYMMSQKCIPYLRQSKHAHILNISPPLNMNKKWFAGHVAYTMAKYGMSMCVLGMSQELHPTNIAVNALWPRTAIWTAAMGMLGGDSVQSQCRKPDIMADAAYALLCRDPKNYTGHFAIDDEILSECGIKNFDSYAFQPGHPLLPDFFLEEAGDPEQMARVMAEQGGTPVHRGGKEQPTAPLGRTEEHVANQGGGGPVDAVFNKVKGLLSQDLVSHTKAIYQFNLEGDTYFIDLKSGGGSCGIGEPADTADVVFTMKKAVFVDMFDGKVKASVAFMTGRLKLKGDMGKAIKLERLMGAQTHSKI